MEEIQEEFTPSLNQTEFLNKVAKIILLKILRNSLAPPSKNARIALIPRVKSLEIKEFVGLRLVTQFGKSLNMEQLVEQTK